MHKTTVLRLWIGLLPPAQLTRQQVAFYKAKKQWQGGFINHNQSECSRKADEAIFNANK